MIEKITIPLNRKQIRLKDKIKDPTEFKLLEKLVLTALLIPNERENSINSLSIRYGQTIQESFMVGDQIWLSLKSPEGYTTEGYVCDMPKTYNGKSAVPSNFIMGDN